MKAEKKEIEFPFRRSKEPEEWWKTMIRENRPRRDGEGVGESEKTALHYTAESNSNPAVIELLVQAGADVNERTRDGTTPLHAAAGGNSNPAVIELLVRLGADVNALDKAGNTPLHYAARNNRNPEVIEALLDAGADPGIEDSQYCLPANYAADNESIKDSSARWRLEEARDTCVSGPGVS